MSCGTYSCQINFHRQFTTYSFSQIVYVDRDVILLQNVTNWCRQEIMQREKKQCKANLLAANMAKAINYEIADHKSASRS